MAAADPPYKGTYVRDLDTRWVHEERLEFGALSVAYTVSMERGAPELYATHPVADLRDHIKQSWQEVQRYAARHGFRPADCRPYYMLHIFVISEHEMFDTGRFDDFKKRRGLSDRAIFGLYDSTLERRGDNNLIVSNINPKENALTMQHELFHYWWDRLCLARHLDRGTEYHATQFERWIW